MLADFLDKNEIKALNEPISAEQINGLKISLQQGIFDKQDEIHQLYIEKNDDIKKIDIEADKFIEQYEQLELKGKELLEKIEDYSKLEDHARHVNSNYHQVHHLNQFIDGVKKLIQLQNKIHECGQLCKKGFLSEAKELHESFDEIINNKYLFPTNNDKFYQQHYPLYESFLRSVRKLRSDICQTHNLLWNDGVDRKTKNEIHLNLNCLDQLFKCTFNEDKGEKLLIEKHIQTFAKYSYENFIQILIKNSFQLKTSFEVNMVFMQMEEEDENEDKNIIEKCHIGLNYLKTFFEILNDCLLTRKMNIQTSKDKSIETVPLMNIYSSTISNDFIEFIRDYLLNLAPNDFQYIDMFRSLIETIIDLEKYLIDINFFSSVKTPTILSSVIGNIDEAIIKSRCRKYLVQCRELLMMNSVITTSLKTIEVGDDEKLFLQNEQEKEKYKNQTASNILTSTISLDELDANMFRFPRTIIVKHVYEYLSFIRQILEEANDLVNYGAHLCATARNLLELFHVIYPNLHDKSAQEYPYLTALHFNTYMYVAQECLVLGEEYYHLKCKTADGQPITFVDYVPIFRNQAANLLKAQIDTQKDTLTSFINEVGGFHNIVDETDNKDILKRAINKCILQLENLSNNWKKVFSSHVYFKVIGYLCDHVSYLLIKETLSLEDIPEQECQIMVNSFTQWSTFLQNILIKNDVSPGLSILARLAPNLTRFNELCVVLNSSLQTIVDRWFNGQGPLASQFTAIEVKQLIRALFQTSERRTAALSKIQ